MSDLASKLAQLDQRASAIRERLAAIGTQRREHAFLATEGDEAAIRKLAELESELVPLQRDLERIADAQHETENRQRLELEAKAKAEQQAREKAGAELAIDVMAVTNQVDQQLIVLRQIFEKRHELLVALERTKTKPHGYMQRLLGSKYAATGAARAAGLDKFLDLTHIEPRHTVPLVESNKGLSVVPTPTAPAPAKRFVPPANPNSRYIG
jgi:chromosome segregation ATPase